MESDQVGLSCAKDAEGGRGDSEMGSAEEAPAQQPPSSLLGLDLEQSRGLDGPCSHFELGPELLNPGLSWKQTFENLAAFG